MRSRALFAASTAVACWLGLFELPLWFPKFPSPPSLFDMSNYYVAARIGIEHGWGQIYDVGLQRYEFGHYFPSGASFGWYSYFVSPPAIAWVMAPLALLPPTMAYAAWLALTFAAGLVAWWLAVPARGLAALLHLLVVCTLFPVLFSFSCGNFAFPLACIMVLGWWLLRREWQVAGGLVLVAIGLKPQVAILVPVALLLIGYRRAFVAWAIGSVVLAAAELLSLGVHGLSAWQADLVVEHAMVGNQTFTPAYLTGTGIWATGLELTCGALALVAIWLNRRRGLELAISTALLGSLLASSYIHGIDYVLLVPAFWLYARSRPPAWHYLWFGAGALAMLFMGPAGPGPLIVFELGWLVLSLTRSLSGTPDALVDSTGRAVSPVLAEV
jgi:hypothetical protein